MGSHTIATDWDRRFLKMADMVATWSKDPSSKFGCVIVRPDRSIVSYGCNNFPRGVKDTKERLNHRPTKYELVVHSETNALLFSNEDVRNYALYVTTVPCCRCAVNIIQAKIGRVVYWEPTPDYLSRWGDSVEKTIDLFEEAGLHHYSIEGADLNG